MDERGRGGPKILSTRILSIRQECFLDTRRQGPWRLGVHQTHQTACLVTCVSKASQTPGTLASGSGRQTPCTLASGCGPGVFAHSLLKFLLSNN